MVSRINRQCAYFPCHDNLEDCAFCYCPFYPCGDERRGNYVVSRKALKVWSCKDCDWIHRRKVVDNIFKMIRSNNIKKAILPRKPEYKDVGVIVLGHGSRLKTANESLCALARKIRLSNEFNIVEPAFLQLSQPDLRRAIRKVARTGCKTIIVVPFFLFMGNHVTRDIPRVIAEEAKRYKLVKLVRAKNLGQDPRMASIVIDRIREVIK